MIKSASVFCASSQKIDSLYLDAASELGKILALHKVRVYYGGGATGLMGSLAGAMIAGGGEIYGIIPEFMVDAGWAHRDVTQIIVENMHQRKKKLHENAEAIISLPGGVGTLEETLEVITLKQLGQITLPVIIVNINNYYHHLLAFLEKMITEGFMHEDHRKIWSVTGHPSGVLDAINDAPAWYGSTKKISSF